MGILKVDERHRSRVCAFLSRREGFHALRRGWGHIRIRAFAS
jgi:hypothetical protein